MLFPSSFTLGLCSGFLVIYRSTLSQKKSCNYSTQVDMVAATSKFAVLHFSIYLYSVYPLQIFVITCTLRGNYHISSLVLFILSYKDSYLRPHFPCGAIHSGAILIPFTIGFITIVRLFLVFISRLPHSLLI